MKSLAYRLSLPDNKLARTFLALIAATILAGSAILNADADANIARFEAVWQDDGTILVVWETSSEFKSMAYFLYRAESLDGPWADYVDFKPATGNDFTSAKYSFVDDDVSQNVTYYYRLEEVTDDNSSNFSDPIVATTGSTSPARGTPTATLEPGLEQNLPPATTTRHYTGTPLPAGTGTAATVPTETGPPALPATPIQAALTRSLTPLVTTPTPVGGVAPTVEAPAPTPEVTATPEGGPIQPTASATASAMPSLTPPQGTFTPSPTPQQLAAARKETSQPLLDASATQLAPAPTTNAPYRGEASSRLVLLLGGGALMAAAILAALVLLIWRRRAR